MERVRVEVQRLGNWLFSKKQKKPVRSNWTLWKSLWRPNAV
jgi:hypothetical protein